VFLSNQLIEGFRAPFPRQDLVAHKVLNERLQFRKYMELQKGEYVKLILGKDRLIVRKVTIS
jgi:hypothetical protein